MRTKAGLLRLSIRLSSWKPLEAKHESLMEQDWFYMIGQDRLNNLAH